MKRLKYERFLFGQRQNHVQSFGINNFDQAENRQTVILITYIMTRKLENLWAYLNVTDTHPPALPWPSQTKWKMCVNYISPENHMQDHKGS